MVERRNQLPPPVAQRRGLLNEQRFNRMIGSAFERRKGLPEWFKGYRAATTEEDARGIDALVETDVGLIELQITSGRKLAQMKRKKAREQKKERVVVRVLSDQTNEKLLQKTIREVRRIRAERL